MDKAILLPSVILGLVLIGIYTYRCHASKVEFDQSILVSTIFQAGGIVCGVLLAAGVFIDEAKQLIQEIDLYILISGIVVLSTSVKGVINDIFRSTKIK